MHDPAPNEGLGECHPDADTLDQPPQPTVTSLSDSSIDIVLLHGANGCRSEVDSWCQTLAALGL